MNRRISKELQLGKAGEHLVCYDLLMKNYKTFLADQGSEYDLVLDYDNKLLKIQVRSTSKPTPVPQRTNYTPAYKFNIKRCGKGGIKRYVNIDIFALVALDRKIIGYFKNSEIKQTMNFRIKDFKYNSTIKGRYLEEHKIENILKDF